MKARCIEAVSAALGRGLQVAEIRTIETRIRDAMMMEARRDPATWQAMPLADQLKKGAELAAKELVEEAALKKKRVAPPRSFRRKMSRHSGNRTSPRTATSSRA